MAESLEAYERVQKAAADKKRAELEAKRKALAEKLMVHGALAQRTCMAANFAFWGFCEVRIHGVLRSSAHSWYSDVFRAMAHIHSTKTGVCYLRYAAG